MSTKAKLWAGLIVVGALALYFGGKLVEVITANRELAKDNSVQRNQKEGAIQQANMERQQKNLALQENQELKTKISNLNLPRQTT